ncbi:MAG: PD40 domain-containing protein [Proteobacteria bacterium]|nr:PD40 domain-containing protein [Pseudomonadota bacterium]
MTLPLKSDKTLSFSVNEATWMSLDVSPQGDRLVIEVLGDLYLLPIEGGQAIPLSTGMHFDSTPRFSPDGSQIAFISDRHGPDDLWIMPADISNDDDSDADAQAPVKLTSSTWDTQLTSPIWSPDGKSIVISKTVGSLGTFELWTHHIDGGSGVQITKAKPSEDTRSSDRHNALGATFSPDGRYLYFANKSGGFGYNLRFPMWQIARRDLRSGDEDVLTKAQGSAFRPMISPDGSQLVYATRYEQQTGLRIRDLVSGKDEWFAFPVQKDTQEAWFERDLLPGSAFTPDGDAIITTINGKLVRIDTRTKAVVDIPFQVNVEKQVAERLHFPYRVDTGPVEARIIRDPVLSPDGTKLAFAAFARIYVQDLENGGVEAVSPEGVATAFPDWSPKGNELVYASWQNGGGHIYRQAARKGSKPKRLSQHAAYYSHPVWSPDGARIVALRGSAYERQNRESDFGPVTGSDVLWFDAKGGEAHLVVPARGLSRPHFGPEADRLYLQLESGGEKNSLVSVRFDGTDRREILSSGGPGYYTADPMASEVIQLSPDGSHVLIQHSNQAYVAALVNTWLSQQVVNIKSSALPLAKLTDVGASFVRWNANGDTITWSAGNHFYQRPLASLDFKEKKEEDKDQKSAKEDKDSEESKEPEPLAEEHEAVVVHQVRVSLPRAETPGAIALVNATAITMNGEEVIEDSVILISDGRIIEVGSRADVEIPEGYERRDLSGKVIVPGYIDTHAHYDIRQEVPSFSNWSFLANLAYGVTTGMDVQPSTIDLISAQDMVDAGLMLGPRAYSTGPGIFSDHQFSSKQQAHSVLKLYKEHYGVRNLKAYLTGDRKQRQWLLQAAKELQLMPTTEGGLDMKMDLTHMIDGFSGNEHNFPLDALYDDVVQLAAQTRIAYTPTLLVLYGGPAGENYFYNNESPHDDAKLRRFTPYDALAARTLRRRSWVHEREYATTRVAEQAMKIVDAGGQVGIGAHGQLQGLGYHWELWSVASGGSNYNALRSATIMGAQMIGLDQDLGSLTAGKLADLVVLNSNPLDDIRNSADIQYVMKGGSLYEGDTLNQVWPTQTALPDQWWWHLAPGQTLAH